ncbi:MAG: hypothetical protein DMF46_09670 [Verrucomicrobia bacterium]|nr:MAG: hypothetical protein DMF46_09670 [Verrucomicrobiota bacterium]
MLKKEAARAPPRRIFTSRALENSGRSNCRNDLAKKSAFAKRCVSYPRSRAARLTPEGGNIDKKRTTRRELNRGVPSG